MKRRQDPAAPVLASAAASAGNGGGAHDVDQRRKERCAFERIEPSEAGAPAAAALFDAPAFAGAAADVAEIMEHGWPRIVIPKAFAAG
jgi:hypothetical protein